MTRLDRYIMGKFLGTFGFMLGAFAWWWWCLT